MQGWYPCADGFWMAKRKSILSNRNYQATRRASYTLFLFPCQDAVTHLNTLLILVFDVKHLKKSLNANAAT